MQATRRDLAILKVSRGEVRHVDAEARELKILVRDSLMLFHVPPECNVFLNRERIDLRDLKPPDHALVVYTVTANQLVARSIQVSWLP